MPHAGVDCSATGQPLPTSAGHPRPLPGPRPRRRPGSGQRSTSVRGGRAGRNRSARPGPWPPKASASRGAGRACPVRRQVLLLEGPPGCRLGQGAAGSMERATAGRHAVPHIGSAATAGTRPVGRSPCSSSCSPTSTPTAPRSRPQVSGPGPTPTGSCPCCAGWPDSAVVPPSPQPRSRRHRIRNRLIPTRPPVPCCRRNCPACPSRCAARCWVEEVRRRRAQCGCCDAVGRDQGTAVR